MVKHFWDCSLLKLIIVNCFVYFIKVHILITWFVLFCRFRTFIPHIPFDMTQCETNFPQARPATDDKPLSDVRMTHLLLLVFIIFYL